MSSASQRFGPPVVSAAWTATLPDPVLGITGLTLNVIELMFAGVVVSSVWCRFETV